MCQTWVALGAWPRAVPGDHGASDFADLPPGDIAVAMCWHSPGAGCSSAMGLVLHLPADGLS